MNTDRPHGKRIALLVPRFGRYGGMEQFGYRLAAGLAQRGHAVDVICGRREAEAPKGVRVLALGRPPGTRLLKMLWFLIRAEAVRRAGDYDLSISLGKTWNQDLLRVGGGPLKIFWEKSERSYASRWTRWRKRLARRLSPENWLTLWVERHQYTPSTRVIAVSHLVRDWLLRAYPALRPENVDIVYNKPDLARFSPPAADERRLCRLRLAGENMPEDAVFLGTSTTNFQLKGVGPLIRSLALLPASVHLFVAGGRRSRRYARLARCLGVAERVHFCGRIEDMPSFYKALDIFILATFYDACSNAVLEALASGNRVLTSASNGAAHFLTAERIFADPGDERVLARYIREQLEAPVPGPFQWPADVESGLAIFMEKVEDMLARAGKLSG